MIWTKIKKSIGKKQKHIKSFSARTLRKKCTDLQCQIRNKDWSIELRDERIAKLSKDYQDILAQLSKCMSGYHCAECIVEPIYCNYEESTAVPSVSDSLKQTHYRPERAHMGISFHPAEYKINPQIIRFQSEVVAHQFKELMEKRIGEITSSQE
jgi:hypothetical protein